MAVVSFVLNQLDKALVPRGESFVRAKLEAKRNQFSDALLGQFALPFLMSLIVYPFTQ